jgi:hypothetical protein
VAQTGQVPWPKPARYPGLNQPGSSGRKPAMTHAEVDPVEARRRLEELFPTRESHLLWQLAHYAETGQRFDATFYDREPSLGVTLAQEFAYEFMAALNYGRDGQLQQLCRRIRFSDGTNINLNGIWTLNYMPRNLDISDVDLSQGEQRIGNQGETMREIIRNIYRCQSCAEEDFFLARFIAS